MLLPAVAALSVPLFVHVLPFTFMVMLLFVDTVTLLLIVVPVLVVVVTAPPFKFNVVADPPESANVSDPVPVGVIPIVPAVVEIDPANPLGVVIVSATFPDELPESTVMAEDPVAVIVGLVVVAANVRLGARILTAPPPPILCAVESAIVSVLPVDIARSDTVPVELFVIVPLPAIVRLLVL